MKTAKVLIVSICLLSLTAITATPQHHQHHSNYAGQEHRLIKSLSDDDIQQLQTGKGWGLAKAAELNGLPGPIHLLQMKKEIKLTAAQEVKIQALYEDMKKKAVPLGKSLVKLEKELNDAFAQNSITTAQLSNKLDEIALVYKKLRFVHLSTHLQTPKLLTTAQITQYNHLRGYN